MDEILQKLSEPFAPGDVTWKPGTVKGDKCRAMAYADLRAYQRRLDEICGLDWSVEYLPWGDDRIIAKLTIAGSVRCSTGEMDAQDEKNNMGGTVAEAQAMKRAAAMFGLGRHLYELPSAWVDYDTQAKKISKTGQDSLDNRYRAWHAKAMAQRAQANTQTTTRQVDTATGEISQMEKDVNLWKTDSDTDYHALFEKLEGNCLSLAQWAKNTHANSNGPASGAQYQYLVGVINTITGNDGSHRQVLGVLVGRAVDSSNPPGRDLCNKLLDWLPQEKTNKETGEKIPNPSHRSDYAECIKNIWHVIRGQLQLFSEPA